MLLVSFRNQNKRYNNFIKYQLSKRTHAKTMDNIKIYV